MESPCQPGFSQLHSNLLTYPSISYFRMTFKTSLLQNIYSLLVFLITSSKEMLPQKPLMKIPNSVCSVTDNISDNVLCFCDFVPPKCPLRCSQILPWTLGNYTEDTHLIPTWPPSLPHAGLPALSHELVGMSLGPLECARKLGSECHFLHLQNIYVQSLYCALYPIK